MKSTISVLLLTCCTVLSQEYPDENQERSIVVSNVTYTLKYHLKSTTHYRCPLTNPIGQPHYDCTVSIFSGTNAVGTTIDTQWTKDGCFEDSPMLLVGRALNWRRYPNNSAAPGLHWVMEGPAMWTEKD